MTWMVAVLLVFVISTLLLAIADRSLGAAIVDGDVGRPDRLRLRHDPDFRHHAPVLMLEDVAVIDEIARL